MTELSAQSSTLPPRHFYHKSSSATQEYKGGGQNIPLQTWAVVKGWQNLEAGAVVSQTVLVVAALMILGLLHSVSAPLATVSFGLEARLSRALALSLAAPWPSV